LLWPSHPHYVEETVEVLKAELARIDVAAVDHDLANALPLRDGLLGDACRLLVAEDRVEGGRDGG